ncbi:MAG: magnesium/cobalt transporter CorA [Mycobacterium leprae]
MFQAILITGEQRQAAAWPEAKARWQSGEALLWLDVTAATPEEIAALGEELGLHPIVVRACLHPEHRSRLKEYKEHFLLVLNAVGRTAKEGSSTSELGRWRTLELNVVIGRRFMLTVHPEPIPALSTYFNRYLEQGEGRPTLEYLLYSLCEAVMLGYYAVLDRIDRYIDESEERIFHGDPSRPDVDRLFTLKRHILYLRRVLGPQRDALGALMRREFAGISNEGRSYFMDAYEHTLRLLDLLDTYRDLISSSLDAYLSTVSNRMSRIMQTLTIVSTVMLPLTLISGLFGMNLGGIPLTNSPWGFTAVVGGMLILAGVLMYYFKRKGWM